MRPVPFRNTLVVAVSLRILRFLPSRFRSKLPLLSALTLLNSWLDLLGLGAVLPLFALVLSENVLERYPLLAQGMQAVGLQTLPQLVVFMSAVLMLFIVGKNAAGVLINRYQAQLSYRIFRWLSEGLLRVAYQQGYPYFLTHNTSKVKNRIYGMPTQFTQGILIPLIAFYNEAITVLFFSLLLFCTYPLPSLLLLGIVTPMFLLFYHLTKERIERNGTQLIDMAPLVDRPLSELISGYIDVEVAGKRQAYFKRYLTMLGRQTDLRVMSTVYASMPTRVIEVFVFLAVVAVFLFGVFTMPRGEILELVGILGLVAYRTIPTVNRMMTAANSIRASLRCLEVVEEVHTLSGGGQPSGPLPFAHSLELCGLGFRYPSSDRPVLEDVNLSFRKGEVVGLIGRSGSGKSTLVNLMLYFLRPTQGHILVDGRPLSPETVAAWRAQVGYVRQDVFIADASLRENIAFGSDPGEVDEQRLAQVVRQASLQGLVAQLEQGLDTPIGERGSRLSGGQRQRIGIARALYAGAQVLFFDEATSALDNETEREITESIHRLAQEKLTMFIVAHRYTTLRHCHRIIELSEGRVVGETDYDRLLARSA